MLGGRRVGALLEMHLKENLWLWLTCGALGCGQKLYGGVGGNGRALAHFEESASGLCVKLGTITPRQRR
jgi:ubiquitin carboxyl-terminal hydrolase 5/13